MGRRGFRLLLFPSPSCYSLFYLQFSLLLRQTPIQTHTTNAMVIIPNTVISSTHQQPGMEMAMGSSRHIHTPPRELVFGKRKPLLMSKPPWLMHPIAALNAAEHRRLQEEKRRKQRRPGSEDEDEDKDDELCPVECVREFKENAELEEILERSKLSGALVVVDFYRVACGSCKYIEAGFVKLCKGSGDELAPVIFLKHNVMNDYEELSEVAERLKIRVVPLFHFYKNGELVDSFPTREKKKILETISKHSSVQLE